MKLFSYHAGNSFLHTLDVRCKCLLVCLISLSVVKADLAGNLVCLAFYILLLKGLGLGPVTVIRQMKGFLLFLMLIFLSRWVTTPGDAIQTVYGITLTRQGLADGGQTALAFLNIMLTGLALTATTRSMEIKTAVQWFFGPVPFIPERRVAMMMGLSLKFMPLILDNARQVSWAVHARCGHLRKNPVKRLIHRTWPLLKKTFKTADDLTLAMQARCYSEQRTDCRFHPNGKEGWVVLAAIAFSTAVVWF